MGVSRLCTRVPGTVRVWCAAADTPLDSQETAPQSSFFFSQQGEESERSGLILPDTRGWSTQSDRWEWGRVVP